LAPEPQSKKVGKELNRVQGGVPVSVKVFGGKLWRQKRGEFNGRMDGPAEREMGKTNGGWLYPEPWSQEMAPGSLWPLKGPLWGPIKDQEVAGLHEQSRGFREVGIQDGGAHGPRVGARTAE